MTWKLEDLGLGPSLPLYILLCLCDQAIEQLPLGL